MKKIFYFFVGLMLFVGVATFGGCTPRTDSTVPSTDTISTQDSLGPNVDTLQWNDTV